MRTTIAVLLLALSLAPPLPVQAAAAGNVPQEAAEYRVKAELLERFTRFVKWPEGAIPSDPRAPFVLCVVGRNPFGTQLDELAKNHRIQERAIDLRLLGAASEAAPCHLLFVAASAGGQIDEIAALARRESILTVADTAGFAERGVMINLFVTEGRVGFEINERATHEGRIEVSSKLLKLARVVGAER